MTTHTLAVRYRPKTFSEVAGQASSKAALISFLKSGNFPPNLLLSGPSGTGKTTLARIAAAAILCPKTTSEIPCLLCNACEAIMDPDREFPDLIERDASSHGSIDDIRRLEVESNTAPLLSSRRVIILDEVHGLTTKAQEAFLKLSEEPPATTIFILATTDPDSLISTLRGRMIELQVERPTEKELTNNLMKIGKSEGWRVTPTVADAIVAATDPALGVRGTIMTLQRISNALELDDQDSAFALLGVTQPKELEELWSAIVEMSSKDIYAALTSVSTAERTLARLLTPRAIKYVESSLSLPTLGKASAILQSLVSVSKNDKSLLPELLKLTTEFKEALTPAERMRKATDDFPELRQRLVTLGIGFEDSGSGNKVYIIGESVALDELKSTPEIRQLAAAKTAAGISLEGRPI